MEIQREAYVCVHTPHHILLIMHSMSEVSAPVIFLQCVHDVMHVEILIAVNINCAVPHAVCTYYNHAICHCEMLLKCVVLLTM